MTIAICDDDVAILQETQKIVSNYMQDGDCTVVAFNTPVGLLSFAKGNEIDLVFSSNIKGHVILTARAAQTSSDPSVITNVSEVPYENPVYSNINSVGRQWIFRYALALVRETLGYIRGKYSTVPIPDSEATLNQQDLLTDARAEKELLITQLRDMLDATSRAKQLEQKANETEFLEKTLKGVPMLVYIG